MRRRIRSLLPLLLSFAFLAACSTERESRSPSSSEPVRGGTLRLAIGIDPGSLNPTRYGTSTAAQVFALLQPSLIRLTPDMRWEPSLALAWSWEDETTLVLELDTRLRWSDGEPFTAHDVAATYELYADTTVGYSATSKLEVIESTEVIDPGHLRLRLTERGSDPLLALQHDILPTHLIETFDRSDPPSWSIGRKPVTLGPYMLARWQPQERLVLERNPHHPEPGYVDRVEVLIVPDKTAQVLKLEIGEVDVVDAIPPAQFGRLQKKGDLNLIGVDPRSQGFLQFNLEDPLLSDRRVREAIALAVDRQAICDGVYFGFARPAASALPPVNWAHDATLEPRPHDPERARTLLAEAGLTDSDGDGLLEHEGRRLRLRVLASSGDATREAMASAVMAQIRAVGLDYDLETLELQAWLKKGQAGEFQVLISQQRGTLAPDVRMFLGSTGGYNFARYANPHLDELCEQALAAPDRTRGKEIATELQRTIAEDLPWTMLYYLQSVVGIGSRVQDATPNWRSPFDGFERWWLADAAPAGGR